MSPPTAFSGQGWEDVHLGISMTSRRGQVILEAIFKLPTVEKLLNPGESHGHEMGERRRRDATIVGSH